MKSITKTSKSFSPDPRGLYPPGSLTWQINRESALLLGGLRALTMQIAHPLVAQGVYEHSRFREEPLGRLLRTLMRMLTIGFGTRAEGEQAAAMIRAVHGRVHGRLNEAVGAYPRHHPYRADDPQLVCWVYATLIDSSIVMYELLVRPLSPGDKEAYFQESKCWAQLLGVPEALLPADYPAFCSYVQEMLAGDQTSFSAAGREVIASVFYPALRYVPRWAYAPTQFLTNGLLPSDLRRKVGFRWSPFRERAFRLLLRLMKFFYLLSPPLLRHLPQARRAARRWKNGT